MDADEESLVPGGGRELDGNSPAGVVERVMVVVEIELPPDCGGGCDTKEYRGPPPPLAKYSPLLWAKRRKPLPLPLCRSRPSSSPSLPLRIPGLPGALWWTLPRPPSACPIPSSPPPLPRRRSIPKERLLPLLLVLLRRRGGLLVVVKVSSSVSSSWCEPRVPSSPVSPAWEMMSSMRCICRST